MTSVFRLQFYFLFVEIHLEYILRTTSTAGRSFIQLYPSIPAIYSDNR